MQTNQQKLRPHTNKQKLAVGMVSNCVNRSYRFSNLVNANQPANTSTSHSVR